MKNGILFLSLMAFIGPQSAFSAVSVKKMQVRLKARIQDSGLGRSSLGVWVGYKGQKIFSLNGEQKFIPASVSKIMPTAVILSTLTSRYQFETRLMTAAVVKNEVLKGDLYLVGGGDPSFTSENLWILVNDFVREGITQIEGDIIVDDQRFDDVRFDPGREEPSSGELDKPYTAPVGAMSFNWNSVNINVRPTRNGEKAKIMVNPANDYIEVINQTRTVNGRTNSISVERLGLRYTIDGHPKDVIKVKGRIGTRVKEVSAYRNITRPDFWSAACLKAFLKQRGITVTGTIRAGVKPNSARLLTKAVGKRLSHAVSDLMKYSNNYMAEMVTKNLAFLNNRKPKASMQEGLEVIRKFLDKQGIKRENYVLTSPSGLSRENKFRPKDIHEVIAQLHLKLVNFPEYLSSLAIGGVDGTLRNRMKGTAATGRIRAKTGTLRGVIALAGFALRPDGEIISFTFMFNGGGGTGAPRRLFDRMAADLFL